MKENTQYDFIIIGSGVGGGAFLTEIAETGARILVLERGRTIKPEKENWSAREMFVNKRYRCSDVFYDKNEKLFTPRMYYTVGGNSKVFGGSAYRFRDVDFSGDTSGPYNIPEWPFGYAELEPFYQKAEKLMHVCGQKGEDPTEPDRGEYLYEPRQHEPYIEELSDKLKAQGLHPFHLPIAVNTDVCRKGSACDGYPCRIKAKHDAEVSFIIPALKKHSNVELWTDSYVERLETNTHKGKTRIQSVLVRKNDGTHRLSANVIVLAAGAINSALLLLRSSSAEAPRGLANSSDQVGRNYMTHLNSGIIAINPFRKNPTQFQKTLALNDYYLLKGSSGSRMGSIQMRGKIKPENLEAHGNFFMRTFRKFIASHSADFWVMTEDYPHGDNRVYYDKNGNVHLTKNYFNLSTHREMLKLFTGALKKIGYRFVHTDLRTVHSVQHQCGTIRCGNNPENFPLNQWCRSFDVENLYVVDASIFPSSAAVNPALTVAANAMRVADHIKH